MVVREKSELGTGNVKIHTFKLMDLEDEQEVFENWGSGSHIQRYEVIQQITAQYEYLLGYEAYLDKIEADVEKLQAVSLFADPDSTAYAAVVCC